MAAYVHKVQYYETDMMGVTHHSNYIRWMEEARTIFLAEYGYSYDRLENMGIISPVLGVDCKYKVSTTFADEVEIEVAVKEFKGVRLIIEYIMKRKSDGVLVLEGTTEHCFLNKNFKPINLKKEYTDFYNLLIKMSEEYKKGVQ